MQVIENKAKTKAIVNAIVEWSERVAKSPGDAEGIWEDACFGAAMEIHGHSAEYEVLARETTDVEEWVELFSEKFRGFGAFSVADSMQSAGFDAEDAARAVEALKSLHGNA